MSLLIWFSSISILLFNLNFIPTTIQSGIESLSDDGATSIFTNPASPLFKYIKPGKEYVTATSGGANAPIASPAATIIIYNI